MPTLREVASREAAKTRKPRRTNLEQIPGKELDRLAGLAAANTSAELRYAKLFANTTHDASMLNAIGVFTSIAQRALIIRDALKIQYMRRTKKGAPEYERLRANQRLAALRLILDIGP